MNKLAEVKNDDLFDAIYKAGCPDIIIKKYTIPCDDHCHDNIKNHKSSEPKFDEGINNDHVLECLKLFDKMAKHHKAGHDMSKQFGKPMFDTMTEKLINKEIEKAANDLCRTI